MAKKKSGIGQLISFLSVILGIVALVMLFLPAVKQKTLELTYSGLDITFGYEEANIEIFKFSFMNLLTYILVLAGIVCAILSAMGKSKKLTSLISSLAFIVGGVFFFLSITFSVLPVTGILAEAVKEELTLGYGAIIGAITSILAGLGMGYKTLA